MTEAGPAAASVPNVQIISDAGEEGDVGRTLLPPIGIRGSRRLEGTQPPPEVDKFQKVMDKVMAERTVDAPGEENAPGHIIARRESQMTAKHGISRVSQGVVDKFYAARHNTAIMSAMGHPGLDKLVAREEEEKRKRKARVKELTAQRASFSARNSPRNPAEGGPISQRNSANELPNVYVALEQAPPTSRATSAAPTLLPTSLPPAQPQLQPQPQQQPQQQPQPQPAPVQQVPVQRAARSGTNVRLVQGGRGHAGRAPSGALSRSAPSGLRPLGFSTAGGCSSSDWDGQPQTSKAASSTSRRAAPGGRWRRRTTLCNPKSLRSDEPVVRASSRVGRVLREFGGHDDWCSVTVMKHSLATILQANIRGWLVRRKWLVNPQAVVDAAKAAIEAEQVQKERRAALKLELERRALTRKQKEKAANVLQMLFPQKSMVANAVAMIVRRGSSSDNVQYGTNPAARAKWSRLNKNLDLAAEPDDPYGQVDSLDASDSDTSDMGLEDMAMVKMRARTPPWQKAEQSQWEGQWAKLNTKPGRGNLDVVWDLADSASRVQAVQQRRAERTAAAEAAEAKPRRGRGRSRGGISAAAAADSQPYDPATQPLPAAVVNELLVQRYIDKYTRLGLLDHLPLRSFAEATLQHQQHQQQLQQQQQQHHHQSEVGFAGGAGL